MTTVDCLEDGRSRDLSRWMPFLAFTFGVLFTALPLLLHPYLPLVDLPNHIARLHIAETGNEGPLSRYYLYTASLVPNAAIDLLWRIFGYPLDAVRFANLVMVTYAVNLILSSMVLARVVHGRWTVWSAASALLVFNAPFFWGFQNFVWALPFCLYGFALWLVLQDRPIWLRIAIFLPLAAILYLMHFFAFGFLAILVLGREIQVIRERPANARFRVLRLFGLMLPFVLPVLWLAITLHGAGPSPAGSRTEFGTLLNRLWMFASPLHSPSTGDAPALWFLAMFGLALLALVFSRLFSVRGPQLVLAPQLRGATLALALAMLVAPSWLNGVALVDIRAPVVLSVLLIAGTTWHALAPRHAVLLAAALVLLIGARGVAFERFAARYESDVQDMLTATETLPAGARLLPVRGPGLQFDLRLAHLQGLLVDQRDVFVPTLFQGVHAMRVRPEWISSTHPALFAIDIRIVLDQASARVVPEFARDWERKFTHVLLMDPVEIPDDPRLERIASTGRFTLFRIAAGLHDY